ncbi:carboxypeptidase-like regulatory domain-containing protein [Asinibacterium sp. OR53]|uniref:carboxypeptidase-like regulatory domain-containing protein n=1 Tax=Asinibacterium sp. OR53 TaxID=925409 RepID=UPI00047D8B84|nr:carboxypeptidase-like regulatory domain-containing protein [Asinibacterium sp. OR53]
MKKDFIYSLPRITGLMLIACMLFAVGCKKDTFNEKDALQSQKDLLAYKYGLETQLEQLRQQGASALAQLQYNFAVQQDAAKQRLADSLSRLYQRYLDSLTKANSRYTDSVSRVNANKRNISVTVTDVVTNQPVAGATVTIPTLVGSVLQVSTDANGIAVFPANGNINVPNPASAIVTKTGYASGSLSYGILGSGSVIGTATIQIWNQSNARNTIKGTVSIQTNFINPTPEFASGKLINVYSWVNVNGNTQRFDWSSLTDANGNYAISVPDLPNGGVFSYSMSKFDSTATLAINGFLPGIDSIPSVQKVPATFYLGSQLGLSSLPRGVNGTFVPPVVARYHAVTPLDSNGRAYYFKGLSFNAVGPTPTNPSNGIFVAPNFSVSNARSVDANGNFSAFIGAKFAGTSNSNTDSLQATFVDILGNSDNYWNRTPSLYFFVSSGPNKSFTIQPNGPAGPNTQQNTTSQSFSATTNYFLITKRTGGQAATNYYDPAGWGIVNLFPSGNINTIVNNTALKQFSSVNSFSYSPNGSITTISVMGGQTVIQDLTFGTGQLNQVVR